MVTLIPSQNLNDTSVLVLKFGEEAIDNLDGGTRTIYGLNNNLVNPQGIQSMYILCMHLLLSS
jgi:hypothetical protein